MTRRWAFFIDAGWLLSASSTSVFGEPLPRHQLDWTPKEFVPALVERAAAMLPNDAELLRIYWYDGSRNRLPEAWHEDLRRLEDLKLRLGRTGRNGQKGVDGLIIHDLITLSLSSSIDDAVVMSGDEDLLEAIETAQRNGVRVHLLEIIIGGMTQDMLCAFDRRTTVETEFLSQYVTTPAAPVDDEQVSGVASDGNDSSRAATLVANGPLPTAPFVRPKWMDDAPPAPPAEGRSPEAIRRDHEIVERAGEEFALEWLRTANDDDYFEMLGNRPMLLKGLDGKMLYQASQALDPPRLLTDGERIELRAAFWATLASHLPGDELD